MVSSKKSLPIYAWQLSAVVFALGFVAWGQGFGWQFSELSAYDLFPLFGITAFSVMWSVYMVSAKQTYTNTPSTDLKKYFKYTAIVVLLSILLHPGILIWQLWRDGLGLPPGSYLNNYVAEGSRWAVILGMISFVIFLSFEFHRKFGKRSWWKYFQYASDIAMVFIFFHALELGPELQDGWFRYVWVFYGITYLIALGYIYLNKLKAKKVEEK